MGQNKKKLYNKHCKNAINAFHSGQYRKSANEYLIAFNYSPIKTEINRWQVFHGYTSLLSERYFEPTLDDISALEKIRDDKRELKLYRVEAGFRVGLLNFDMGNRSETGENYRETLRIGTKKITAEDKVKVCEVTTEVEFRPMNDITNEILEQCQKNLDQLTSKRGEDLMEKFLRQPRMRSNGTPMPDTTMSYIFPCDGKLTHDDFDTLLRVSGEECDHCKKKSLSLSSCATCKMAFYCSKKCQKKQWKLGHKQYCRPVGEFQVNDYVRLHGLQSKPELNGMIVKVIGPADSPGRFEVRIVDGKSISVSPEKMRPLRPLDCLERFVSSPSM